MAIKTISLELDAYEKLKKQKRGKESFSSVVRRAEFPREHQTGAEVIERMKQLYKGDPNASDNAFEYWEKARKEDAANPRITPSKWDLAHTHV